MVNQVATEVDGYSTTYLALAAARRGHEVWYLGVGDVRYEPGGRLSARAHAARCEDGDELGPFLDRVKQEESRQEVALDELDAVMLRNDTVEDLQERPWAVTAGTEFGFILAERGVTVVNDPTGLTRAASKLYLEEFPGGIRPRSLISRDQKEIVAFVEETGPTVLKPLTGAKGRKVFMIEDHTDPNLNQAIEAILEDGYVIAQARVTGDDGDLRMFLVDGKPLEVDGVYAAVRRVPRGSDPRANISTGGKPAAAQITPRALSMVEQMTSRLRRDGMFLVGIDVVGDKVIEINVESPGGLQSVQHFTAVDFSDAIVEALEERIGSA